MDKRLHFIDQLRALAIFLIIFEHNDHSSSLSEFSTSFSVPLFFVLSALVSSNKASLEFFPFVIKQAKRLLIPYFSLSAILFLFWVFVGKHFGESADKGYEPIKNFIGIFYAQGGPEFMNWGIPMWFIPALFVTLIIDFFVSKLKFWIRGVFAVIISLTGYFLFYTTGIHFPWSIDVAMSLYGFYFLGTVLKHYGFLEKEFNLKLIIPIITIAFALHVLIFGLNGRVLYYYSNYGVFYLMYLNGILGFLWTFLLFRFLKSNKYMVWVGMNTLPILAFHLLAMTLIKAVSLYIFNFQLPFNVWLSLCYSVLQIIILIPAILTINRYFPFLVGTQQKKYS
jgi:acyltransferase